MTHRSTAFSPKAFVAALVAWLLLIAAALPSSAQTVERPSGWADESHGNRVPANYDLVLPDDRINEVFISFTPESWAAEEADMIELYGERGAETERGTAPGARGRPLPDPAQVANQIAEALGINEADAAEAMRLFPDMNAVAAALGTEFETLARALGLPPGFGGARGPGARGLGGEQDGGPVLRFASRNPIWVPVTVRFRDQTWWEVGFRYKGNSTLQMGWRSGRIELPFKLDFDEFEDAHLALDNQRFYGFKQLSFGASDFDPSLQREKITADIFRDAGVPAAETAYYAVYVDNGAGDGFHYWGIYTAVELPDDTLIETQFTDDNGNMYKPEGPGATFAAGSFNERSFDKETNRDGGYEDVLALFDALHAETRLSDPAAWRANLETVFDVVGFLRWLAANTLIQNWDTYGVMSHNYYLYADEMTGRLVWIPWDNNMALSSTMGGRGRDSAADPAAPGDGEQPAFPAPGGRGVLSLALDDVEGERWPLIGYVLEQKEYHQFYVDEVARISREVFTSERMIPIYEANFALLAEYVTHSEDEDALTELRAATDELIRHVNSRAAAASSFLQAQAVD